MTDNELCTFLNSHRNVFSLPISVEKGRDVFPHLYSRLDDFLAAINEVPELADCVKVVKKQIQWIKNAVNKYYSGDIVAALQENQKILDSIKRNCPHAISLLDDWFIDNEKKQWFRARQSDCQRLSREDMLHVPASKRGNIHNYRYSINGIPCLYLSNSAYTCWEELNRPPLDNFWISRYLPMQQIKILNISTTPDEIINASTRIKFVAESNISYDDAIKEYIYCFALQCACSVVVQEGNQIFHEEYVVPQLLMMQLHRNKIDGIMYFSTKLCKGAQQNASWISKNIAIPAFDLQATDYSNKIKQMFVITEPINIGLFSNIAIVSRNNFVPLQTNIARTQAIIFVNNIASRYCDTVFYRSELELCQDYYQTAKTNV